MKFIALAIFIAFLALGCNPKDEGRKVENSKEIPTEKTFTTKSRDIIRVTEVHPLGLSISTVKITTKGFEHELNETLENIDPLSDVFVTDLDNNGYDEIYLITIAAGSGSYGNVIGFASNRDKSMSMINFPEINDLDAAGQKIFTGFRGHDHFSIENSKLNRIFPVYNENDSNANPTGGKRKVIYGLFPGEAMWQLKIEHSEAVE